MPRTATVAASGMKGAAMMLGTPTAGDVGGSSATTFDVTPPTDSIGPDDMVYLYLGSRADQNPQIGSQGDWTYAWVAGGGYGANYYGCWNTLLYCQGPPSSWTLTKGTALTNLCWICFVVGGTRGVSAWQYLTNSNGYVQTGGSTMQANTIGVDTTTYPYPLQVALITWTDGSPPQGTAFNTTPTPPSTGWDGLLSTFPSDGRFNGAAMAWAKRWDLANGGTEPTGNAVWTINNAIYSEYYQTQLAW